jgi:3-methyladenine DNA glycosylase AlkD
VKPAAERAAALEEELAAAGTEERAVQAKRYLKCHLRHLGVTMPVLRKTVRAHAKAHALDRDALWALVDALWPRPVFEARMASVELLQFRVKLLEAGDLGRIEALLRACHTWALVDPLAVDVAGHLVATYPANAKELDRWAKDESFWVRRAAMLSLLRPLREGGGDFERFGRYADAMLGDKEFFIRKAIGWILRETSKKRPELVSAWITPRRARASGVTLREATKYLEA